MLLLAKIILIGSLGGICYQDVKDRKVYWFLFPITALSAGLLFWNKTITELFFLATIINLMFVSSLLLIVLLYARLKLKTSIKSVFGMGDLLLFIGLSFTFSSISFIVIFSCSLIFSLLIHLFLKKDNILVPLAGYMSLFFGLTYIAYWSGVINSIYSL
ncbi:hypothetical protein E5167_05520 [Pontimicrobium aquaticum]|uniref:Prepilin type IV endopeptidase peptidase domain-containing protein n=1 Tax=Pontimicrobium aquaticum TaxID=2565367 RepID=A0A4U0F3S7_9FLAO|nr:hypothetical protein E5167_05520 [Pontimicrobium aquaticum]